MSDTNVSPLRQQPIVPNFSDQAEEQRREAALPSVADRVLEQVINRTIQTMQERAQRPDPFRLSSFEEIEAFADRLAKSGLCPQAYKHKADDIIIAVILGKEVGLPAMASVQSIAVINGRPSLWGEAVPGLCMATGQVVDVTEHFEGEENAEDFTAVCVVTRRGYSPREGRFSAADRKRAGLANVHNQYPKDMMMWRARHRAWHGIFPDVLRGLGTAEIDAEEAARPRWVMPRPERSDTARTAKAEGDAWDDTWFDAAAKGLFEEQDAWRWLELLQTLLKAAPSLRDVQEIEGLNTVTRLTSTAPDEVKVTIAEAFVEAQKRFGKPPLAEEGTGPGQADGAKPPAESSGGAKKRPARKAAAARTAAPVQQAEPSPPESTDAASDAQEPEFEYAVLDSAGEPIDGVIHTDPLEWAEAFAAVFTPNLDPTIYEAGLAHNADAIQDARKDPEAAQILDAVQHDFDDAAAEDAREEESQRATAEPPAEPVVIEPALIRGKPDWPQYIRDLTAALHAETAESLARFVDAQRARAETFPASTRLQATAAIVSRAQALGIEPPPGLAGTAGGEPQSQDDKDRASLNAILEHLSTLTDVHAVQSYSNQVSNRTLLERWKREEKIPLVTEMTVAFERRSAEIRRGEV